MAAKNQNIEKVKKTKKEYYVTFDLHDALFQLFKIKRKSINIRYFYEHHKNDGMFRNLKEAKKVIKNALLNPILIYDAKKRIESDKKCIRTVFFKGGAAHEVLISQDKNGKIKIFHANRRDDSRYVLNELYEKLQNGKGIYYINDKFFNLIFKNKSVSIEYDKVRKKMVDGGFAPNISHSNLSTKVAPLPNGARLDRALGAEQRFLQAHSSINDGEFAQFVPHSNLSTKVAPLPNGARLDRALGAEQRFLQAHSSTNERNYNKNKKQNQELNMNNENKNISKADNAHYVNMKIEPMEFFTVNDMGFAEANAIKYITRYKSSQGDKRMQDIKKSEHYIQILQEAIQNGLTPKNKRKNSSMAISASAFCEANNIEGRDREFIVAVSLGNLEVAKSVILNTMRKEGIKDKQEQTSSLDRQVGGNHYSRMPIQPMNFISANQMGFGDGNIIKYVTRYKFKNGLKDLEKAQEQFKLLAKYDVKKTYDTKISIDEYCQKNKITGLDAEVLKASYNGDYTEASRLITDLISQYKIELENEKKIDNKKEKTMENTTKNKEILLDKIEQAEISKLEEIYKNNVLVKHFCEALDLYPMNYDSALDDKDIVKELYQTLKNPSQIKVNNYKPFLRGAFDIADYMDDEIDEESGEFLDREGFMERMTEYLTDELNETKNQILNLNNNTQSANYTLESTLSTKNISLWRLIDNAIKNIDTNNLDENSEELQALEDLKEARDEMFSLLDNDVIFKTENFGDSIAQAQTIEDLKTQIYNISGSLKSISHLLNNELSDEALQQIDNFSKFINLAESFSKGIGAKVLADITIKMKDKDNELFEEARITPENQAEKILNGENILNKDEKEEIYNKHFRDINMISKNFLPADLNSNLIDLAELRTDMAIKSILAVRYNKDLSQISELEQSYKLTNAIEKYNKIESLINDKEDLFSEVKSAISNDDRVFLKSIQHSLAENILKIDGAKDIYSNNYLAVNELAQKTKEMNCNNTNLIELAVRSLEVATLKLVQEHYPKSEITQAINEKLAISKIQSELNYRNDNSLFDENFSQKDYYQSLLNGSQITTESYKEQLYRDFKEEIDTITQTFIKDSSLDLSELRTDLALKIISASALKQSLNTISELAELEKINTALEQYGLLEQAKYNKENLFEEKFISSYKLEEVKRSTNTNIQINSFVDKALEKIQSATKDLYNSTLNTIYTDKISAKLDETPKQPNPSNQSKIGLRDYQQVSVDALLKSDKGLVEAPTGSGKTHIIAGLIEQSGLKTLIVTPSVALVGQAYNTIKQTMPGAKIGILGGATKNKEKQIENDIVISTWQSLSKMNIDNLPHKMLIVDECHHATADVLQSIIQKLNQNGLKTYGLSATAYRTTDEQNDVLKKTFGNNIAHKVDVEYLYKQGYLVRPSISIITPHQRNFNFVGLNSSEGVFNHIIKEAKDPKNDFISKICNYCYSYHKNCPNSEFLPKKTTPNGNEKPIDKSEIYKARDILQNYLSRNPNQDDFADALYNSMKGKGYELKNSTEQERKNLNLIGEYMRLYADSQRANSAKYERDLRNQPNGYTKIIGSIKSGIDNCKTHRQDVYSVLDKNISNDNNQSLVLANTVDFAQSIANEIKSKHPNLEVLYLDGKQSDKTKILDSARNNNNYVLVATTQSMSEGVDIPNINKVIVASPILPPFSSMATLEQVIGRSIRPYEDKNTAEIIMFDLNVTDYKNKFEDALNIVIANLHPKNVNRFANILDYQNDVPQQEQKDDNLFNTNYEQYNINTEEALRTNNNLLP